MEVIQSILRFLDAGTSTPPYFGVFHIVWLVVTIVASVVLCILWKKGVIKKPNNLVLVISLILLILGFYKQIVLSFSYDPILEFNYNWNNFPWHFLSVPLCIGIFIGLTSGEINKHFLAYFATYGLLAGFLGMLDPNTFVPTIGLNVYAMLCYGSMIAIAVLILFSQQVRIEIKTFLKALPVFIMVVGIAIFFNEIAHLIFPWQNISMFSISRHFPSDTPVYSWVHNAFLESGGVMNLFEYSICIIFYIVLVSVFAALPLLILIGIKKLLTTDFDAEYDKDDIYAMGIRKSEGLDGEDDSQEIFKFRGKVNSKKNTYLQTYFKNLHTNFGNNLKESCGYVAASMLLSYYDTILSEKIVPRRFDKVTLSHDEPNLKESPGTKFYQPAYDPETVTYRDYIADINLRKNTHLHECLLGIALNKHRVDLPKDKDSTDFGFGSGPDDINKVIQVYLKKVANVKKSEYDIHLKDNTDEIKEAKTADEARKYSKEIRDYAIRKVRKGYPVLLGLSLNRNEGHVVIAYDYDKKADLLYCHFGYAETSTHLTPEEMGYKVYDFAMVLDFDERKISHTHTDNYEVVINGALFYYCPDGRYTTSDDLVVEFGKGKQDLSITGVYKTYPRDQLTVPESIGNVRVASIGKYAFENQEHLKRVVLSCNIPAIPKKAFEDCEALETVVIPSSVQKLGSEAFGECFALKSIMFLGTKEEWHKIKKHRKWNRHTGNYRVYCTDGVLIKLHSNEQGDLL